MAEPELAPSSPARLTPEDDVVPFGKKEEREIKNCVQNYSPMITLQEKGPKKIKKKKRKRTCLFNDSSIPKNTCHINDKKTPVIIIIKLYACEF